MIIDELNAMKPNRFHYKLLLIAGLGWAFDAMDTGIISFIMPVLTKEWHLTSTEIGMLGSIGLLGMAIGAILAGALADHIGRKKIITWTMLLYGIATALSALAPNYEFLLFCRLLVGLGLGGELPVVATLITEYSPQNSRGRFMVMLESFWAIGWLLAALIAYLVIPLYGWRIGLAVGALPALYTGVIRAHMPESLRYLMKQQKLAELNETISQLERATAVPLTRCTKQELKALNTQPINSNLSTLWSKQYALRTAMLWITWFGIIFSYYGIFMWLPSLIYQQGFTIVKSFEYLLIMTVAQFPGYISAAYLVDKIGRRYTLSLYLLCSGISSYFFGHATSETVLLTSGIFMSFFNLGAWGVIYTYTPELYPTEIRGLGSGWAAGIGRIGGIIAPILVGFLLSQQLHMDSIFYLFASVFVLISIVVLCFGKESKQQALESIK
ncbi:MFS transporter [Veillonella criceti]|uniref:Niacin/nicotinamide transporter NaiP n=1 Tax=Veillonella criceti TaxID=103891 RepID=A0A380NIZ1_9FIRM|nr:MFS transporter [Veillonella criceti]SUP41678.1 Putative niacin/nicotinamide transporter NaiP [Veillonella criceti]